MCICYMSVRVYTHTYITWVLYEYMYTLMQQVIYKHMYILFVFEHMYI
jgi:hypothetical protein